MYNILFQKLDVMEEENRDNSMRRHRVKARIIFNFNFFYCCICIEGKEALKVI